MSRKFIIQKALIGIGGELKSIKKLRSGDLLIETISALKSKTFLLAKTFIDSPLTVSPHRTLNSCRGVISEPDLLCASETEILEGLFDQGVTQLPNHQPQLKQTSYPLHLLPQLQHHQYLNPLYYCNRYSVPTTSNYLSISATSSSSSACSVLETTTITSNAITATSQDAKETSKPRRKKRPPKNTSNAIKPKIEINMAPHKPRKSAPTKYTTDLEDMIVYDGEDEHEPRESRIYLKSGWIHLQERVS
ncbi:uncharacterized protein TNCV_658841 [Trichonephila clavipes]|nr:uncharacterized protein TNCV_658841 [Trichonephila clavipes]